MKQRQRWRWRRRGGKEADVDTAEDDGGGETKSRWSVTTNALDLSALLNISQPPKQTEYFALPASYIFHPGALVPDRQTTTYPQLNVYTFHNSPWVISYINGYYYTLYIIHCICWLLLFSSNCLLCCESMIYVLFWYIREGRGIKTLQHWCMGRWCWQKLSRAKQLFLTEVSLEPTDT
jgi:hypothetical protein